MAKSIWQLTLLESFCLSVLPFYFPLSYYKEEGFKWKCSTFCGDCLGIYEKIKKKHLK